MYLKIVMPFAESDIEFFVTCLSLLPSMLCDRALNASKLQVRAVKADLGFQTIAPYYQTTLSTCFVS